MPQGTQFDALLDGRANLTITDDAEARLVAARHAGANSLCAGAAALTRASKALLLPRRDDVAWAKYVNQWIDERGAADEEALEAWIERLAQRNASDACEGATRVPVDGGGR